MLPALQLSLKPAEGHTFTRRPQWTQPLESLWGILTKWQFANCVPYTTIATHMFSRPYAGGHLGVDLRVLEAFDLGALAHHSGLSRPALAGGACSGSAESLVLALTSAYLRYCPACMGKGFHATLFQFTPIKRCPIHHVRLRGVCRRCRGRIPYRLDAAFAARPFACPHCAYPLLADATILMMPHRSADGLASILRWQRFLAKYAYWYASGLRAPRDEAGRFVPRADGSRRGEPVAKRLAFIGVLQRYVKDPPPLPQFGSTRVVVTPSAQHDDLTVSHSEPSFSRQWWPHFHTKRFRALYQRYSRFHDRLQRFEQSAHHVTLCWRRSWEGAMARICTPDQHLEDPPFGVAEWSAFAPRADRSASTDVDHARLALRFEQDLQLTWDAWGDVINHLGPDSHIALHPRLIPPRACWMAEPPIVPESPALGIF